MQQLVPAKLLTSLRLDASTKLGLPSEVIRDSRRRVRVAAAIGAVVFSVYLVFNLTQLGAPTAIERTIDRGSNILGLCLCTLVYLVAVIGKIEGRTVMAIALVAQVLLCAMISIEAPWVAFARTGQVSSLTWVVPVIILFPLLVPVAPLMEFLVSCVCALTAPIALWALEHNGVIEARASDYWASCIASAIAVSIAVVSARTIHGAVRQVAAVRQVGSYELLERMGQGGMGEVWKARHSFLARPAAVKLILPEKLRGPTEEQEAAALRFTREAQVTASLRSPHTVELFDFGASSDGTLYYAMELLEGLNAEHFVYRFGPVEPRRVVNWLQQACHSLGEAHARELVHRDIKPANILLCRYGRDVDFIKILDFGLTKPTAVLADATLTTPGVRMGTPGYMAPEQVFGLETGPRTDLYALGCVGYFLLAGVKPFEGDTPGELLRQHAQSTPPPLSSKAPHPVPERLEALIMACLSKDEKDRPANADRMSADLGKSLDDVPWTDADAQAWWAANLQQI